MHDILIREATPADAAAATTVSETAFAPLRSIYRPTGAALARQAERAQAGTRIVAELDGPIVATVQYDLHADHIHVIGLAVHPDFQRKGIARQLLDWICIQAKKLGQPAVVLDTIRETGNVPLFETLGFRITHEETATWCVSETYQELHVVKLERLV
ncbi:GNAT family N-acetyltransferase [Gimesia maris]|uniref:GNAT family N-acetyltransferase n=1 Tax=Gimesia maris TaxID=122 RepID=UPI00241F442F|nr:GNAT family N-acetyltransferase [Gimesia maris]|tara:strand:+ start:247383 stop:247853 length:471 start_codon:yes stop_codon:yes gene_type:complete